MADEQNNTSQESPLEDIPWDELLRLAIQDRLIDLHVALPARVESYDPSTQTVTVTPMVNRYVPDGNDGYVSEQLPQISDVPVSHARGGGFLVAVPLQKGDMGRLVFCERNIGAWRSTGAQSDPGDTGTHTLDGATFDPFIAPDNAALKSADGTNLVIGSDTNGSSRIVIKPGGEIDMGASASAFVAMADKVLTELTKISGLFDSVLGHHHSFAGTGTVGPPIAGGAGTAGTSLYTPSSVASKNLKAEE